MEEQKIVYVDHIAETGGVTFGRSESLPLSHKNLLKIYEKDLLDTFKEETYKNGVFRYFDKYCQFIFSAETIVIPKFCIILTFIDCNKNVDAALDFYTVEGANLKLDERRKFMELFNEIDTLDPSQYAILKVEQF